MKPSIMKIVGSICFGIVMRLQVCVLVVLALAFPMISVAQDCAGDVQVHLNWCSGDHGFNEGATCGFNALAGSGAQLPPLVAQPILGNTWDRTNMMGAAVVAWQLGATEQAVEAAICCQIHNSAAYQCLSSHRDLVAQWLNSR